MDRHLILDLSQKRRVFVVGDIHGEYAMLEEKLTAVNFDRDQDTLVSLGDLADRGPQSMRSLEYIKYPWFHRVLGNHELAPRLYLEKQYTKDQIEEGFGGKWFTQLSNDQIVTIRDIFEDAPVMMTVITPGGYRVGIAHADCKRNWDEQVADLASDKFIELEVYGPLWSRIRIADIYKRSEDGLLPDHEEHTVSNIDHVFHGHTPLAGPMTIGNRSWIDTGACFGSELTMWDIDDFLNYRKQRHG